ncbi:MAG: hypothetical protein PHX08_15085 [Lachnospiraceae bacterium]|nr:hypothetical protein [Lachnospiraceae bacterium]
MGEFKLKTPIAYIIFNRLDCVQESFQCIKKIRPPKLYLISDGPRKEKPGESEKVEAVRSYVESQIDWPCDVKRIFAEQNMGCKYRIYSGLNWVFEQEEQAIILEDDCVPLDCFFQYCQELLDLYRDNEQVMMISSFNILHTQKSKESYFFSKFPSVWGWATWKSAWNKIDLEMSGWEQAKREGTVRYAYDAVSYLTYKKVADNASKGKLQSWAVPWGFTRFIYHGVGIVPGGNMIRNVGYGRADATNTSQETTDDFSYGKAVSFPLAYQEIIEPDTGYDKGYLKKYFGIKKLWNNVKYLFKRLGPKLLEIFKGKGKK